MTLTYLSERMFFGCKSLTEYTIPHHIQQMDNDVFMQSGLKKVTFLDNITEIPRMTFAYCDSLREVNFHENFRKIGEQAFYNCWALEHLDLPQSIQEYDQGALSWTGLKSIALPDGLTALPDGLLSYNGQLEDVYIPQSVTVFWRWGIRKLYKIETNPVTIRT